VEVYLVEVDQPGLLQHGDVVEHGVVGLVGELSHQGVLGVGADLGDGREDLAVRDPHDVDRRGVELLARGPVHGRHELLLLRRGQVGQGDAQLRRDPSAGGVQPGVADDQVLAGLPHLRCRPPLHGHQPQRMLPESRGTHLHHEVPVLLGERPVPRVGDDPGLVASRVLHPEHGRVGERGEGEDQGTGHEGGPCRGARDAHRASRDEDRLGRQEVRIRAVF
jgi:hypothetical protein